LEQLARVEVEPVASKLREKGRSFQGMDRSPQNWKMDIMKKKKSAKPKAKKSPKKRVPREDFTQAAARIVKQATQGY
jgi:hypothetical protein